LSRTTGGGHKPTKGFEDQPPGTREPGAVAAFQARLDSQERARKPGLGAAEERLLVDAARAGDPRALRRLLEGVSSPIYRFARGFCRNDADAEDVLQGVLSAIARSLKDFRGDSSLTTWAYTVARNACIRQHRRSAREPKYMEQLDGPGGEDSGALQVADPAQGPHEQLERRELRAVLEEAIAGLPQAQREVLVLRDVEGLPAREVGETLGLGERAVKSRLHRARLALRRSLSPYLRGEAPAGSARRKVAAHCPDTARMLSRHLEGELDSAVCARLETHVSGCPSCGAACRTLLAALGACRDWGAKPLPPETRAQVRRAIRAAVESGME
jgi:RNA polymerase sigma-70 factor, ECF subfamily